jgi:nicotinate-nucleotide pyrophosphorylase (carboxylating)
VSYWLQPEPANWWHLVDDAMQEDIGSGDVTSGCLDPDREVDWYLEAQADGIVCGLGIAEYLFAPSPQDPSSYRFESAFTDGDAIFRNDRLAEGKTTARRALMAERTALNFMMHLGGIASLTNKFVKQVEGTNAKIIDTRKTIPTYRALAKYAVRCGGGHNHRMGLYDGVLIKDNHIRACGSIAKAIEAIRGYVSHLMKIEVECESLEMVAEAVRAGADVVMLDNMDPFQMREAVSKYGEEVVFEASGGITLDTVKGVAQTGVHYISVGQITHSAPSLSMHLELE